MVPVPAPAPPWRPRTPFVVRALAGAVQLAVLMAALGVVCAHFAVGLGLQRVLSDSMRPTFAAGDLLVVVDRAPRDLRVGDVPVLLFSDGDSRAHRIVSLEHRAGHVSVLTRGDANTSNDSWTDVADVRRIPVAVGTLPAAPAALSTGWQRIRMDPLPLALLLGLGAVLLTGWTMRRQYQLMRSCTCRECLDRRAARALPTPGDESSTGARPPAPQTPQTPQTPRATRQHRAHQEIR